MEENKFSVYSTLQSLFDFEKEEIDEYVKKNFPANDAFKRKRLRSLLRAVAPYCEMFVNVSDRKLKRKAGLVFLSKLDYTKFSSGDWYESDTETYSRVSTLFRKTTGRGINPYKIIYCQVLLDGELGTNSETFSKAFLNNRSFENIYQSLKQTLNLSEERVGAMFEKCSTLIAKVYADRIPQIYRTLSALKMYDSEKAVTYIMLRDRNCTPDEVADILENNPSLFTTTQDRIHSTFKYLYEKADKISTRHKNLTKVESTLMLLRKWVKNNSSLFLINADTMYRKERYLQDVIKYSFDNRYQQDMFKLFYDPINLSIINAIPYSNIAKNALKNIRSLERFADREAVSNYLTQNPYFMGMDNIKLNQLLDKIEILNSMNPNEGYFSKFLKFGKSLFASNLDFSVEKMVDRLKKENAIVEIDINNIKENQLISKFVELFLPENYQIQPLLLELIEEKKKRMFYGEKSLRKDIRKAGSVIRNLTCFLKNDQVTLAEKRDSIYVLAENITGLHERRLRLTDNLDINLAESVEIENGAKIEGALKTLRDAYEQKRFNLSKKFLNTDLLYEKMMEYLSMCFDDKEAIISLFRREVRDPFVDSIKSTYPIANNVQQSLCKESLVVEVPNKLAKPLGDLSGAIDLHETDLTQIVDFKFEKQ